MSKINSIITFDVETGGLSPSKNPITQIAYEAFQLDDFELLGEYCSYVKPYNNLILETKALEYSSITEKKLFDEGLDSKEIIEKICIDFQSFNTAGPKKKPILVGHNVGFDIGFLTYLFNYHKIDISKYLDCNEDMYGNKIPKSIDTLALAKMKWADNPNVEKFNLTACIQQAQLPIFEAHSALDDVRATTGLFLYFTDSMKQQNSTEKSSFTRENIVRKAFQF